MKEGIYPIPDLHLKFVLVRRNETICCLIGFGIGVGCCILYRLISNFLAPSSSSSSTTSISPNTLSSLSNKKRDVSNHSHLPLLMKLEHVYKKGQIRVSFVVLLFFE